MPEHVMTDLETVDKIHSAAILQFGAVRFTANEIIETKEIIIEVPGQLRAGRTIDFDTICWWAGQGPLMKEVFDNSNNPNTSTFPDIAAKEIWEFYQKNEESRLWSNGLDFDMVIIDSFLNTYGHCAPGKFWNRRCYKTVKRMLNCEAGLIREGKHHRALGDAMHQARGVQALFKKYPQLDC